MSPQEPVPCLVCAALPPLTPQEGQEGWDLHLAHLPSLVAWHANGPGVESEAPRRGREKLQAQPPAGPAWLPEREVGDVPQPLRAPL